MRTTFFCFVIFSVLFLFTTCQSKKPLDTKELAAELDSIYDADQKYRRMISEIGDSIGWDSPLLDQLWEKMRKVDSSNVMRIIEIIDEVGGYPGTSLVGKKAGQTAFLVLQHAPDSIQSKYYDMIIDAGNTDELAKSSVALYRDRYLMHHDKPQIFGTQIRTRYRKDSLTGERVEYLYLWHIADTTNIDSLRSTVGLGKLEEYVNEFGISRWSEEEKN